MKKTLVAFIMTFMLLAGHSSALRAGVGFSIGATAWYTQWLPAWNDGKLFLPPLLMENMPFSMPIKTNTFKTDPAFLYGPSLALSINRVSITSVFMYGRLTSLSTGYFPSLPFLIAASRYHRSIERFDSDSTVGYRVHDAVKLFLGFKYQGYRYNEKLYYLSVTPGMEGKFDSKGKATMDSFGPGMGIGFTIPLYNNLFLLNTLSVSFLFGSEKYNINWNVLIPLDDSPWSTPGRFSGEKFYTVTGNGGLSLAYYIEKAGLTLAMGFRYQVQYYLQNAGKRKFYDYNHKFDHSYGATLSVVYSFSTENRCAPGGSRSST
ncbi:MAG: hypothetical protein JW838_08660 [Spirochaetes bacterium]|nr:hypothetical protein [Spirochaetota bacterium]